MMNVAISTDWQIKLLYDMRIATQKMKEPETIISVQYKIHITNIKLPTTSITGLSALNM